MTSLSPCWDLHGSCDECPTCRSGRCCIDGPSDSDPVVATLGSPLAEEFARGYLEGHTSSVGDVFAARYGLSASTRTYPLDQSRVPHDISRPPTVQEERLALPPPQEPPVSLVREPTLIERRHE